MPPIRRQVQDVAWRDHSLKNLEVVEHVEVNVCTRAPRERMAVRKSSKLLDVPRLDEHHFLYTNTDATIDDLREAVTTYEDTERIARRVLGGAHPQTAAMEEGVRDARDALHARETPSPGAA